MAYWDVNRLVNFCLVFYFIGVVHLDIVQKTNYENKFLWISFAHKKMFCYEKRKGNGKPNKAYSQCLCQSKRSEGALAENGGGEALK